MPVRQLVQELDWTAAGEWMYRLIEELYPLTRSITGDGVRRTLRSLERFLPLGVEEVPSGTPAFDWIVPKEWNIRDAYVKDGSGRRVIDFQESNLHVVSYSVPVRTKMSLSELKQHLHTLPDRPGAIPYRTSYYQENWGFCLTQECLDGLQDGTYEVCIDSALEDGSLTYGECRIAGERDDEILVSTHVCHPSLCNDNLSGIALVTCLARQLLSCSSRYSYRFLFIPGTIGSIVWLSRNMEQLSKIRHGVVVANVGDSGGFTYKRSRRGSAEIDRAVSHVLQHAGVEFQIRDFVPYGYDERQYCSPGFDLPVGSLTRTPHGEYPGYHTSEDDLVFVRREALGKSFEVYCRVLELLEDEGRYRSLNPHCEPQLGKRGLYRAMGGAREVGRLQMALLWVLNQSDGERSLLDIAERAQLPFAEIRDAALLLQEHDLLAEATEV
jgi:aminopeptidase-like protein